MSHRLSRLLIVLGIVLPLVSFGQHDTTTTFQPLLRRLHSERFHNEFSTPAAFSLPLVYRDSIFGADKRRELSFEIRLADQPLNLQHRVIKLTERGYPVAYSVAFQGCVVALFANGKFGCYRLPDLAANEQLEQQLNSGSWKRFWLIEGKLVAQNVIGTCFFEAATGTWHSYRQKVPLGQRPKLYEDASYLAYSDCNGEFGGTVYFYNKQTKQTHRANATCANSLWQENGQYRLLTSLGHMSGSADCAVISDPETLPLISAPKEEKVNWQYSFTLPERGITPIFSFSNLQLFGGFRWQNQTFYIIHWRQTTFLATIAQQRITIADPLFADNLYTHNPITTTYGPDLALTNLNFYGLGEHNEVATLLWQGQQLTKIEWGQQP
jgi:hypothetical protein